jgi:Glyoxalase-like domain
MPGTMPLMTETTGTTETTGFADLAMVSLDCDDPRALAEFYHQVIGGEITYYGDDYAMISGPVAPIGFGRVAGYRAPDWPDADSPKRYHLDLYVDDLDEAEASCVKLGASKPDFQPGGDKWRVLTDPAGHPFCICVRKS